MLSRAMTWAGSANGLVMFSLILVLFIVVQPTYQPVEIVPQFILSWLFHFGFLLLYQFRTRWSVDGLSIASVAHLITGSMTLLLAGYTALTPALVALNASPPASGAASPAAAALVAHAAYSDELSAPFVFGLGYLSIAGAGGFPMFPRFAFLLYFVPAIWLVANGAWAQPRDRFLKIGLLHTLLLLQVRGSG